MKSTLYKVTKEPLSFETGMRNDSELSKRHFSVLTGLGRGGGWSSRTLGRGQRPPSGQGEGGGGHRHVGRLAGARRGHGGRGGREGAHRCGGTRHGGPSCGVSGGELPLGCRGCSAQIAEEGAQLLVQGVDVIHLALGIHVRLTPETGGGDGEKNCTHDPITVYCQRKKYHYVKYISMNVLTILKLCLIFKLLEQ